MASKTRNYMGVLVVNHYTAEEAMECVGAQLPSPSITEVALYQASRDTETGVITRGKQINKVRMTDLQFGQMIGRPNFGSGQLVTIEASQDHIVSPLDKGEDPSEEKLKVEMANLLRGGDSGQITRFFKEMGELTDKMTKRGRMIKSDHNELEKYLRMFSSYVKNSEDYSLNSINKIAARRVDEAKSSIHHTVRNAYRIGHDPLLSIDDKRSDTGKLQTIGAAGYMMVSVGGSTSMKLFDDINMSHSVVSLRLATAVLQPPDKRISNTPSYRSEQGMSDVQMSPEQYARFVRADRMEVPCTITRRGRQEMDEFESEDTRDVKFNTATNDSEGYNTYLAAISAISDAVNSDELKGKDGMRKLASMFTAAEDAYEVYLKESSEDKVKAVGGVFAHHQKEIAQFFDSEVKNMPEDLRKKIGKPLGNIVSQVNLLKHKK